jgi:hypothetical protein
MAILDVRLSSGSLTVDFAVGAGISITKIGSTFSRGRTRGMDREG